MKILSDIIASIAGNTKTRVSDPFLGSFIVSWVVCNWKDLALLFWGQGKTEKRIYEFYFYLSGSDFFVDKEILIYPLLLTVAYLFLLPWMSLGVKSLQRNADKKLHIQAVDENLSKLKQREALNKAMLRANPEKQFLEQIVQIDINRKNVLLELLTQRAAIRKEQSAEAAANASKSKLAEAVIRLDKETKELQHSLERKKIAQVRAQLQANLASNRFPVAYLFLSLIEGQLSENDIKISLSACGKVVASIFGYDDFPSIIYDESFNNDTFSSVKYVYFDLEELVPKFEEIIAAEDNSDLTSDVLLDCVQMMFENLPYKFVDKKHMEELSVEFLEKDRYSILQREEISGVMAETDTNFDEIEVDGVESSNFNGGFVAVIKACASGSHRKEVGVPGQGMSISVEVKADVILGENALGILEFGGLNGEVEFE